jgi:uncharacterized delta-60 repeat protein
MDLSVFNVAGLAEQRAALRLPDGGVLVVGSVFENYEKHVFVARLTPSGALDPTWGASGVATYDLGHADSKGTALALDTQGRVILVGATDAGASVVRLASNGALDASFGTGGTTFLATPSGASWLPKQAFVLSNGDLAVCGDSYDKLVYAVLDSSGTAKAVHELSAESAAAGISSPRQQGSTAHSFALQPDGNFVGVQYATGPDGTGNLALLRTTASGSLDPTFGSGGVQMVSVSGGDDFATSLLVQPDGGILVAGFWSPHFGPYSPARPYIARLLPNGSFDASFGSGGKLFLDNNTGSLSPIVPTSITLAPDGGILVAASWYDSAALYVVRANGTLDTRYPGGVLPLISSSTLNVGDPYDLAVAANGTFVMAVEARKPPYWNTQLGLASGDLFHPNGFGRSFAGTAADDRLEASALVPATSDNFAAGAGNDVMIGHLGWDSFDGGAGTDTVMYPLARASYTATRTSTGWNVSGPGTSDSLVDVERLAFNDGTQVALDIGGNAGQAYRLYQAAFDRSPDGGGLSFWIHELDVGRTLEGVAAIFADSKEFTATYGPLDNRQFVTQLYSNVLHRAPDGGGLAFWQGMLDEGGHTRAWVLTGFSESQENQVNVIGVIEHGIQFTPFG